MRIIHAFERVLYPLLKIKWFRFFQLYSKSADIVVFSSLLTIKRFHSEIIAWELGFINALIDKNIRFNYAGFDSKWEDKIIFWSPHSTFFKGKFSILSFENASNSLSFIANQLEKQGNRIFVNSKEILLLENKYYMHQQFLKKGIRSPKTWLFENREDLLKNHVKFPVLFKENHSSGSQGLTLINNQNDLKFIESKKKIVIQELLNIRMDMRVTLIGYKIISSYWRILNSKEWKPTSTSNGSFLKFEEVPKKWESFIIKTVKKMKMDICGMDIAFQDDNIKNKPLILEVSPRFSQNPNFDPESRGYTYKEYKKKSFLRNSFRYKQTEVHMSLAKNYLDYIFEKNNFNIDDQK